MTPGGLPALEEIDSRLFELPFESGFFRRRHFRTRQFSLRRRISGESQAGWDRSGIPKSDRAMRRYLSCQVLLSRQHFLCNAVFGLRCLRSRCVLGGRC